MEAPDCIINAMHSGMPILIGLSRVTFGRTENRGRNISKVRETETTWEIFTNRRTVKY